MDSVTSVVGPSGRWIRAASFLPFAALAAVYGPAAGHGFIADDFRWILESRTSGLRDAAALFSKSIGFYRPVVSLTFAADAALFGTQPLGYGLTNLALAALSASLLYLLLRALSLPTGAALFGSALWLFNPHGMNTAILWTSGRTALLLTAFALGAALAMVRGRPVWFLVCLAGALLSKEEAVTLPVILLVWRLALRGRRVAPVSSLFVWIGGSLAVIAAYAILRSLSGAMTPSTAPYYYAFTSDPRLIARNVFEYLDRAATLPAGVTALALLLMRPASRTPLISTPILICGLAWLAGGYAITVFLPIRSSLYACYPSIGACLIAADVCARRWTAADDRSRARAAAAGIVVTIVLAAVVYVRSRDFVANADFSTSTLRDLVDLTKDVPSESTVVIEDDRGRRPNLESAFGASLGDAYLLSAGRRLQFWIDPPSHDASAAGLTPPCEACVRLRLAVAGGHLIRH